MIGAGTSKNMEEVDKMQCEGCGGESDETNWNPHGLRCSPLPVEQSVRTRILVFFKTSERLGAE